MKRPLVPDGKISRAVREGLILRKQLLADGVPEEEADRIVGQGLKGAWEHKTGRTDPWHYYCDHCKDTGWRLTRPTYVEMQRLIRLYGEDPQYQPYYVKCEPCKYVDRQREERRQQQGRLEGVAAAGQTKRLTSGRR